MSAQPALSVINAAEAAGEIATTTGKWYQNTYVKVTGAVAGVAALCGLGYYGHKSYKSGVEARQKAETEAKAKAEEAAQNKAEEDRKALAAEIAKAQFEYSMSLLQNPEEMGKILQTTFKGMAANVEQFAELGQQIEEAAKAAVSKTEPEAKTE